MRCLESHERVVGIHQLGLEAALKVEGIGLEMRQLGKLVGRDGVGVFDRTVGWGTEVG